METESVESIASSNDGTSRKVKNFVTVMLNNGRILDLWKQEGSIIYEMDSYGGILYSWTLGKHCYFVKRERVITITDTYTAINDTYLHQYRWLNN